MVESQTILADRMTSTPVRRSGDVAVSPVPTTSDFRVRITSGSQLRERLAGLTAESAIANHPAHDLRWLSILADAFGHRPYLLEAVAGDGRVAGCLTFCLVRSVLFGRFLVGLPYLNSGGLTECDDGPGEALIDKAVELADELDGRHLQLRHERRFAHPSLAHEINSKVHMRLALPPTSEALWDALKAKVRNQVRKGQKQNFAVRWGGAGLVDDFYRVFSQNMRDLGTPVYGRRLFTSILRHFGPAAEICVLYDGPRPIAGALLVHGREVTEVPSASSLRAYNGRNANMLMYWLLLERAVERGQRTFDFGRSTVDGATYRFKKQWGAQPSPAIWQYYQRRGSIGQARPENGKYRFFIRAWQKLPLPVANALGPWIVRGIP